MRTGFFLCISLFFCILECNAAFFRHLGISDGLSQISVYAICQDRLGRIWLGTHEGLSVYNGMEIISYKPLKVHDAADGNRQAFYGNHIRNIVADGNGDLFIVADDGLVRYDIRQDKFYGISRSDVRNITASGKDIWCVCNDSLFCYQSDSRRMEYYCSVGMKNVQTLIACDNGFLIGSSRGLFFMKKDKTPPVPVLSGLNVKGLYPDSEGWVWVATMNGGCYRIKADGKDFQVLQIPLCDADGKECSDIRCFTEDMEGKVWIGTFDGLFQYDVKTKQSRLYTTDIRSGGISHSSVYSLLTDRNGVLWIGTYYGGVNYLTEIDRKAVFYDYNPYRTDCLSFPVVGDMAEDKDGNLWICLDGGGLALLNRATHRFLYYKAGLTGLPHDNLKSICYDAKRNRLYIGTHKGGLSSFNMSTRQFNNYEVRKADRKNFPADIIDQVELWHDSLIVAARNGLFLLDGDTGEGRMLTSRVILHVTVDSSGNLWGVNTQNIYKISLNEPSSCMVLKCDAVDEEVIFSAVMIMEPFVYLTTLGHGMLRYNMKTKEWKRYTVEENGLLSDYCYNLCKTEGGNILISTDKGIALYNPSTGSCLSRRLGIHLPDISIAAGCGLYSCKDGELFVGGSDGMSSFKEEDMFSDFRLPSFYFSKLSVNNNVITAGGKDGILSQSIAFTKEIELGYEQNNILLEFASPDWADMYEYAGYEYMLEGFDRQWVFTDKAEIRYTNLPAGDYCLKVCPKYLSGMVPSDNCLNLRIKVDAAWYSLWWVRLLFLLQISVIIAEILRVRKKRREIVVSLQKEQAEKERMEEINRAKLSFFTSISHEFRTPLTLIIAQTDLLLRDNKLPQDVRLSISGIEKNSKELKALITELLDFRKIELEGLNLRLSLCDIMQVAYASFSCFSDYARQNSITYSFKPERESCMLYIDEKQMQRVFQNLLSNAFKYTQKGGEISMSVEIAGREKVVICVKDTGKGISPDDIPHVFDCFYRSSDSNENNTVGTGIGLFMAKTIVMKHHGHIHVDSVLNSGSCFVVEIPLDKSVYEHDREVEWDSGIMTVSVPPVKDTSTTTVEAASEKESAEQFKYAGRKTILIVEDDTELQDVLRRLFAPFYNVMLASNGKTGIEQALQHEPDLILSDVMMPEMSGMELCSIIKGRIDLCHIPVVLLTALDAAECNMEGLQKGADDYVTKPFDSQILLARCNNIIRNRVLLQEKYIGKRGNELSLLATNPLDRKMLDDVKTAIDANLDNADFNIDQLCREVGMSRTLLQKKFKALTSFTLNDYILQYKLKLAASMLVEEPYLQINEIAERLGYVSPRYFSRVFKEYYKVSPADYKKNANNKENEL